MSKSQPVGLLAVRLCIPHPALEKPFVKESQNESCQLFLSPHCSNTPMGDSPSFQQVRKVGRWMFVNDNTVLLPAVNCMTRFPEPWQLYHPVVHGRTICTLKSFDSNFRRVSSSIITAILLIIPAQSRTHLAAEPMFAYKTRSW